MNELEIINYYNAKIFPYPTALDVAKCFQLPYFKIVEILRRHQVKPHIIHFQHPAIAQYLVDYYHLENCTLNDLAQAFGYHNASNVHRVIKNNPYYQKNQKKRKPNRVRSDLVDLMWQPDLKAYEAYLEIKDSYPNTKAWIGVNKAIQDYINEGYIPVKSYNFVEKFTTLSLKPEVDKALMKYSNFFDISKNQVVNCALKKYLQDDKISYN